MQERVYKQGDYLDGKVFLAIIIFQIVHIKELIILLQIFLAKISNTLSNIQEMRSIASNLA